MQKFKLSVTILQAVSSMNTGSHSTTLKVTLYSPYMPTGGDLRSVFVGVTPALAVLGKTHAEHPKHKELSFPSGIVDLFQNGQHIPIKLMSSNGYWFATSVGRDRPI